MKSPGPTHFFAVIHAYGDRPDTMSPMCAAWQLSFPAIGLTCSDQRHPASTLPGRSVLRPAIDFESPFSCFEARVSSGVSALFLINFAIGLSSFPHAPLGRPSSPADRQTQLSPRCRGAPLSNGSTAKPAHVTEWLPGWSFALVYCPSALPCPRPDAATRSLRMMDTGPELAGIDNHEQTPRTLARRNPCWADLSVADVAAASRFYSEVRGFVVDPGPEYGGYVIAQVDGDTQPGSVPTRIRGRSRARCTSPARTLTAPQPP